MADIKITSENWPAIARKAQAEIVYDVIIDGHHGDLMSKDIFIEGCEGGMFIDYDGNGDVIKADGTMGEMIRPSTAEQWPDEGTHILWYNK